MGRVIATRERSVGLAVHLPLSPLDILSNCRLQTEAANLMNQLSHDTGERRLGFRIAMTARNILSRDWILPLAIILAAFGRLILILVSGRQLRFYDESEYWSIAQQIASGHGFRLFGHLTAYRPPAMPYFLALGMMLGISHYWVFALANAALLCALPLLVYQAARDLKLGKPLATLAALLVAFHPGLNYAATTIYPTTITAVSLTLAALLAVRAISRNSAWVGVLSGLAAALAASATTVFAPYGLILAFVALVQRRQQVALLVAVTSMLPVGVWIIRNHIYVHTDGLATNGGFNMELGANDQAEPRSGNLIRPDITPEESYGDEVVWDRDHRARARAWIAAHPARYTDLALLRALAVFDSVGRPATPGLHNSLGARLVGWAMLPLILLGLLGLFRYRSCPLAWVTAGALFLVMLSSGLTIVKPRFRFPCDPLLMVFAAGAIKHKSLKQDERPHV
jgi:4-amino-4-deoxy-L-arabinose transferase-like glycosyltransferase